MAPNHQTNHRIGVITTRMLGTDGVSLETDKWVEVLQRIGHTCFFFTSQSDKPAAYTHIVPQAHFRHPDVEKIYVAAFSEPKRSPDISVLTHKVKDYLKDQITWFVNKFQVDMLLVENALAIPLNIPLGLALTEFIAETGLPTIAHHHDFFWERKRFLVNCVWDYLNMAFPPHLPYIQHVVINSSAANQLSLRTGISSTLIPNVMNFENPPQPPGEYTQGLRQDLGVEPDEFFFLQPTRVVQRKGIEHAIEFIHRLGVKARLVISHATGDEDHTYEDHLREFARLLAVPVNFVSDVIQLQRNRTIDGRKIYALWDVYPHADLITYPSDLEGFGNTFLEAVYFRRPILVNNYSIYAVDIKPKGFRVIEFDGYITEDTLQHAHQILENPQLAKEMAEHNYRLGRRYYSYSVLGRRLQTLLADCFGEDA
ncbi:MAG: glycosyl transferase family 1 [Chloroflexi bacterium RBG_16_57_11]|nr:MAG: glycosyl transferase family 1 [Chloroflexi bacterium RBG_16_57_11]